MTHQKEELVEVSKELYKEIYKCIMDGTHAVLHHDEELKAEVDKKMALLIQAMQQHLRCIIDYLEIE